jgi:hypothetical protein
VTALLLETALPVGYIIVALTVMRQWYRHYYAIGETWMNWTDCSTYLNPNGPKYYAEVEMDRKGYSIMVGVLWPFVGLMYGVAALGLGIGKGLSRGLTKIMTTPSRTERHEAEEQSRLAEKRREIEEQERLAAIERLADEEEERASLQQGLFRKGWKNAWH